MDHPYQVAEHPLLTFVMSYRDSGRSAAAQWSFAKYLVTLWSSFKRLQSSMARRGFMPLDSVLRQLDTSTDLIADGSDDDLGMNVD